MGGSRRVWRSKRGGRSAVGRLSGVTVVSHDAGGAEILASLVARDGFERLVLEGPAVRVFERRVGSVETSPLEAAVESADWVLCGTSWQSDLEWRAIDSAKKKGKRVVAFLDHWVNYRERFLRSGVEHLPDELWVADEYAERLAKQVFPDVTVVRRDNPYLEDVRREFAEAERRRGFEKTGVNALFVAENISTHALGSHGDERHWGYTEFDAIEYFLSNVKELGLGIERVIVRPHPSDPPGKYNRLIQAHSPFMQPSEGMPLVEEIALVDVVVGCESMAMVAALACGKKVVSCIPPGGMPCRLPHEGIVRMNEILSSQSSGEKQ